MSSMLSRLKLLGNINEAAMVAAAFRRLPKGERLMLDVGASRGAAFKHVLRDGWKVIAFEPNPDTNAALRARWENSSGLRIESTAISNQEREREFFRHQKHSGMSGFYAYDPGHQSIGVVAATTLAKFCQANNIGKVDFLKIDTEGEDLAVLEGVPWSEIRPRLIEVEYAPGRSTSTNTFEGLVNLLEENGYRIHVSEYEPFQVDNLRWRRFVTLPDLPAASSWGNIIATSDREIDSSVERMMRAVTWPWKMSNQIPLRWRSRIARAIGSALAP
jgi:FkbM family methyltransferase